MVSLRRGTSSLGCLFSLLVLAAIVYFGVNVGEVYFRFYQFQDAMRQEVRFAAHNNDALIHDCGSNQRRSIHHRDHHPIMPGLISW